MRFDSTEYGVERASGSLVGRGRDVESIQRPISDRTAGSERGSFADLGFLLGLSELLEQRFDVVESLR